MGHVFWVRNVVVSTFAGNQPAAAAAEQEVVANAKQIAAAIEPYYGKDASEKLFGLLAGHYGAVKQYLEATVAGNKAKQDAAFKSLSGNAYRNRQIFERGQPESAVRHAERLAARPRRSSRPADPAGAEQADTRRKRRPGKR